MLDVVLAGNGYAYAFPRADQWEQIRCINLTTGQETLHSGSSIYAGTKAKLHPGGTYMYGADNGLSPSDIEKYDFSAGTAKYLYDSPYHGTYPMCGDLWISDDGLRVFTKCGRVFRSSELKTEDLTYNGALGGINSIQHLAQDSGTGNLAVIPGNNSWSDQNKDLEVQIFDYQYLTFKNRITLPRIVSGDNAFDGHGRFVFYNKNGNKMFVILQADGSSGLLYNYGLVVY